MKFNILKKSGITLMIYFICIDAFGQELPSVSIKLGGLTEEENTQGVVPSAIWNNVIKGNSSGLLDNKGNLTSCFIRSNTAEAIINSVDNELLNNSLLLSGNEFITFLNVPYDVYDVYIYTFTNSDTEAVVKYTINGQNKFLLLSNTSWDGMLDESTATSESMAVKGKDYLVFKNLTNKEFTIWSECEIQSGPAAIQIVKSISSGNGSMPEQLNPELTENAFIYPNPAKNDIYIELHNNYSGSLNLKIIDLQGIVHFSLSKIKEENSIITKIDVKQLRSGNYYVVAEYGNKRICMPFIKC